MTTMKDVARAANVGLATVSATLSGTAYVSPELKSRVSEAVKALGYAPNAIASGLKRGTTRFIGLVVPDITNPFFTELIHEVQRGVRQAGYSVLLSDSERDVERELALLRLMRTHLAAGTILCPTGPAERYADIAEVVGSMALLTVDSPLPGERFDAVLLDNARAARLATEHIIGLGHRRVAIVAGPPQILPGSGRLEGFQAAMRGAGLDVERAFIRDGGFREDSAFVACTALLRRRARPTAVFVANNQMLIGVMRAVAAAGLACPTDISVAAIDDFPWASAFSPALTTVRQPIAAMAQAAIDMLLKRLGAPASAPRQLVMEPELVVRNSCAPPPEEPGRGRIRASAARAMAAVNSS